MITTRLLTAALVAATALPAGAASAAIIDQQHTALHGGVTVVGERMRAQTFRAGASGLMTGIDLRVGRAAASPISEVKFTLLDLDGLPLSNQPYLAITLAETIVPIEVFPFTNIEHVPADQVTRIPFVATPIVENHSYAVTIESPEITFEDVVNLARGPVTATYPFGEMHSSHPQIQPRTWTASTGNDLWFRTLLRQPGDYNDDDVVSVADYTVLRDQGLSYDEWRANFGVFGQAAVVVIPEPSALALVFVLLLATIRRER
jgi:hypothetical protein